MAFVSGNASNIFDLVEAMDSLLLSVGWVKVDSDTTTYLGDTRLSYAVWQGSGDGNDKIYLQAKVPSGSISDVYIDSFAGFDENLEDFEQPGSIQQWLKSTGESVVRQPKITISGTELYYYWLFANTYRIIGITRMSIQYESFYMGFINPIASERQFPYPMYICGNGVAPDASWPSNKTGSFVFPHNDSGWLRRADGTWRSFSADATEPDPYSVGTVFPYNAHNKQLIPNYKGNNASSVEQNNFLLLPVILQTTNPIDMCGLLRGVYWISGTRDLAAEQTFVYGEEQYMTFDTKQYRDSNSYFCIKMD